MYGPSEQEKSESDFDFDKEIDNFQFYAGKKISDFKKPSKSISNSEFNGTMNTETALLHTSGIAPTAEKQMLQVGDISDGNNLGKTTFETLNDITNTVESHSAVVSESSTTEDQSIKLDSNMTEGFLGYSPVNSDDENMNPEEEDI